MSRFDSVKPVPPPVSQSYHAALPRPKPIASLNVDVEDVEIKFTTTGRQFYVITVFDPKAQHQLPQIKIRPGNRLRLTLPADQPEGPFNAKK